MSDEKNLAEAHRWLTTARGDMETARVLRAGARWAHACFHAQQAAEKAMKALWYSRDLDPWGHSILQLIDGLKGVPDAYGLVNDLRQTAGELDRFYIPTRYPNGLPGISPEDAFYESDASRAMDLAGAIIDRVSKVIGQRQ